MGKNGKVITKTVKLPKGGTKQVKVYKRKKLSKAKQEALERALRPDVPRAGTPFWTNPAPHKGNCNCTICHHVNNCTSGSPALGIRPTHRDHDGKSCRQLGLALNIHDEDCTSEECIGIGLHPADHRAGIPMPSSIKIDSDKLRESNAHKQSRLNKLNKVRAEQGRKLFASIDSISLAAIEALIVAPPPQTAVSMAS